LRGTRSWHNALIEAREHFEAAAADGELAVLKLAPPYKTIEIFSEAWWTKPMDEVLRTCIERHRTVV